ncbi:MAG: phosphate acyltransferase, partial [Balneolaceae bacterium]
METPVLQKIQQKASGIDRMVVFPEAAIDTRVLRAANHLMNEGMVTPLLLSRGDDIRTLAEESGLRMNPEIPLLDLDKGEFDDEIETFLWDKMSHKNPDASLIEAMRADPLVVAGWLVATNRADGAVAGSVGATASVIRAAIRTVGVDPAASLVSSMFLMSLATGQTVTYADCGVVPYPDAGQLASIAITSGHTHRTLTGEEPRIAMLSFSTRGSAEHERTALVREATAEAQKREPDWAIDGELQFDAAFVADVASRKAPDSPLAGNANVFIFPNLDAGNIAYKITERIGGATAVGPILQGLARPYMDLSRGCSP